MILPLLLVALAAPPELIALDRALGFTGEALDGARCSAEVVPAPDAPQGQYTLKVTYRLERYQDNNWLDCNLLPAPPLDLSAAATVGLWVRAEQETGWLTVKITDPDNPGANHSARERPLLWDDKPLPAKQWVHLELPLPADPKLRDNVDMVGFYLATSNTAVPLNQDLVFELGRFDYVLPPRPPWPPKVEGGDTGLTPLELPPLAAGPAWVLVRGTDNQTDHAAAFGEGGVTFDADADGWNEFLHSSADQVKLAPSTTYRLQYDYTVLRGPSGPGESYFYQLVRAAGTIQEDVGWQRWDEPAGTQGRRVVTFATHDKPGYYVVFGVRNHGAIRIGNLRLWRIGEAGGER